MVWGVGKLPVSVCTLSFGSVDLTELVIRPSDPLNKPRVLWKKPGFPSHDSYL